MSTPVAYSLLAASHAFSPHLSERFMRKLVRSGVFKTVTLPGSRRRFLIHDELVEALRELGRTQSNDGGPNG
jgi:hypothetical protein